MTPRGITEGFRWVDIERSKTGNASRLEAPEELSALLRERWRRRRSPFFVFPGWVNTGGWRVQIDRPREDLRALRRAFHEAGLNEASLQSRHGRRAIHALRGTYATLISNAIGARAAQEVLGHASISTTEDYLGDRVSEASKAARPVVSDFVAGLSA